jgi:hypothetical protein
LEVVVDFGETCGLAVGVYSTMRWVGHVASLGEQRGVYRVLVGKSEGNRSPSRPKHRWENNIKMNFHEVGYGGMYWIKLVQDRDRLQAPMNLEMNLRVP